MIFQLQLNKSVVYLEMTDWTKTQRAWEKKGYDLWLAKQQRKKVFLAIVTLRDLNILEKLPIMSNC